MTYVNKTSRSLPTTKQALELLESEIKVLRASLLSRCMGDRRVITQLSYFIVRMKCLVYDDMILISSVEMSRSSSNVVTVIQQMATVDNLRRESGGDMNPTFLCIYDFDAYIVYFDRKVFVFKMISWVVAVQESRGITYGIYLSIAFQRVDPPTIPLSMEASLSQFYYTH